MKKKSLLVLFSLLLVCLTFILPMKAFGEEEVVGPPSNRVIGQELDSNVGNRVIISNLDDYNTWIPADYTSNVFNFTSNTTIEAFGVLGTSDVPTEDYFKILLPVTLGSQEIGYWYRNVGEYKGESIDIKVTFLDYYTNPYIKDAKNGAMRIWRDRFWVDYLGVINFQYRYEFYKSGTNELINIKSLLTFGDLDGREELGFPNFDTLNISQVYLHKDTYLSTGMVKPQKTELRARAHSIPADNDNTPEAFVAILFEGTSFIFSFENMIATNITVNWPTVHDFTGGSRHIVVDSNPTPHQVAPIEKTVSDSDESDKTANTLKDSKEDYTYHFRTSIDQERQEWWYKSYEMVDDLPAGIKLKSTSSVKVYDELTNADITSEFTVSYTESSRRLSIKAKNCQRTDFYGRNLLVNVPVTVTDTSVMTRDDSPSETRVYVNNKVNLNVTTFDSKARTQTSATVKTYIPIKGKIKIIKVDDKNNDRLADAVFDIAKTASGGNVVSSNVKTNANGEFLTGDLPVGDYYVKEIQPPLGYQTITETWEKVTVKDQETAEITFKNKQTLLHVRQVVLKAHNELVKPTVGYFQLQQVNASNQKNGLYQLVGNSSEINTSSAVTQSLFTTVQLPINKEKLEVSLIIPEYYRYVGVTSTNSGTNLGMFHVSGGPTFDPSSQPITVNYTTSSEYWISIFIEPKFGTNHAGDAEDAPRPYSWESLINDFGNIKF